MRKDLFLQFSILQKRMMEAKRLFRFTDIYKHYYIVKYVRLPDLMLDLQAARDEGSFTSNTPSQYY